MRPFVLALLPLAFSAAASADTAAAGTLTPDEVRDGVLGSMDRTADPCQDFYRYACGSWLDTTKLPSDQPRWSRSFSTIGERNREALRQLLEEAARDPGPAGTERQKTGDFYASCMDEAAVETIGAVPLRAWYDAVGAIKNVDDLFTLTGRMHSAGVPALFRFSSESDFKNPGLTIGFLSQGGLGLPDRDYYVSTDPKKQEILAAYGKHVEALFALAGVGPEKAAADAAKVVAFETELAKASRTRTEMRETDKLYNKIDRVGLDKLTPTLPWKLYLQSIGYPAITDISVSTPEFIEAMAKLIGATPRETIKAYLDWKVTHAFVDYLSKPFVDADFEFYGKTLSGQAEIQPRWKRCVAATGAALGEAMGKLYVEQQFPGASKQVAAEMIVDIEQAFESNLAGVEWMDDATREAARVKARSIGNKIGFPDEWRDYSSLAVTRGDYLGNVVSGARFENARDWNKVGKPTDRVEWEIPPQTVNAYYHPVRNEIVFPAGILQPPFFHKDYPAALNYGGIGAVVGHELTHGFDDQGRKFDSTGVLREWWAPEVAGRFEQAAKCVANQFSNFEVEPGVTVNGQLTLGEDIADLGGVKEAYSAYKSWETRHGEPPPIAPGLTNDQLLFVGWAQVWCTLSTPEYLRRQVTTDPHAPGRFRAIAAPMNSPDFQRAFGCKAGDRMVPAPVCTVW